MPPTPIHHLPCGEALALLWHFNRNWLSQKGFLLHRRDRERCHGGAGFRLAGGLGAVA